MANQLQPGMNVPQNTENKHFGCDITGTKKPAAKKAPAKKEAKPKKKK